MSNERTPISETHPVHSRAVSSSTVPESERLAQAVQDAQSAGEQRLTGEIHRAVETLSAAIVSAEREAARMAIDTHKETLEILRHERDLREVAVAQQERTAARLHSLQTQLLDARSALEASLRAEAAARRELEILWGSTSWRYTRPLREIGLIVRRAASLAGALFGRTPDPVEGSDQGASTSSAGLSPSSARVVDELRQAMDETRRP